MTSFLFGVVVLAGAIALAGFLLPSQVHVERQTTINASPEQVFSQINDFHAWNAWSPWATMDPEATLTIQGSGMGQTMVWDSQNPNVGKGRQEITQLEAPHVMKTHLDFGDMGRSDVTFTLKPIEDETSDDKTQITWSLDSDMREGVPMIKKPMNNFMGFFMDSMLGKTYEEGLANLKSVVER